MCSEICSPRMSFSCDLVQAEKESLQPLMSEQDSSSSSDPSSDFEFNVCSSFDYESSSADELFADGMILPFNQIHHKNSSFVPAKGNSLPPLPVTCSSTNDEITVHTREVTGSIPDSESKPVSKSFWGFKRSVSLNSDSTQKKGLISSLQLLSRSNSTGSVPTPKRTLQKQPSIKMGKSSSSSSSSSSLGYGSPWNQKPPLVKKSNGHGAYRVSPVLNVPPPTSLFGFGSLFCNNGKDKKKIRR